MITTTENLERYPPHEVYVRAGCPAGHWQSLDNRARCWRCGRWNVFYVAHPSTVITELLVERTRELYPLSNVVA